MQIKIGNQEIDSRDIFLNMIALQEANLAKELNPIHRAQIEAYISRLKAKVKYNIYLSYDWDLCWN